MNLLALDTSTLRAALGVLRADGAVFVTAPDPALRHGRALIPALRDLLGASGLRPGDLGALAVGLGPGSYTGLRIGLTAAKTLAYAAGVPLFGLESLDVLARNASADAARVSVIADAQRGDLYAADFARAGPGGPLLRSAPIRVVPFAAWAESLAPGTLVLGPALDRLRTPLPAAIVPAEAERNHPDGHRLLDLAREVADSGQPADPWFLEPLYLRRSSAEEKWDRWKGRPGT